MGSESVLPVIVNRDALWEELQDAAAPGRKTLQQHPLRELEDEVICVGVLPE